MNGKTHLTALLNVRVDPETLRRIAATASHFNESDSSTVRRALKFFLLAQNQNDPPKDAS
jgi:negative regulator of replication initiation